MLRSFIALVGRNLAPNRAAIWITALANVTAALVPVLSDVGAEEIVAPVVGLNALCLMFLRGWQQFEKAGQTDQLETLAIERQLAAMETAKGNKPKGADAARALGLSR